MAWDDGDLGTRNRIPRINARHIRRRGDLQRSPVSPQVSCRSAIRQTFRRRSLGEGRSALVHEAVLPGLHHRIRHRPRHMRLVWAEKRGAGASGESRCGQLGDRCRNRCGALMRCNACRDMSRMTRRRGVLLCAVGCFCAPAHSDVGTVSGDIIDEPGLRGFAQRRQSADSCTADRSDVGRPECARAGEGNRTPVSSLGS